MSYSTLQETLILAVSFLLKWHKAAQQPFFAMYRYFELSLLHWWAPSLWTRCFHFPWASRALFLPFYLQTLETVYHNFFKLRKKYIILNIPITIGYKILEDNGTWGKMDGNIIKLRVKLALYSFELYLKLSSKWLKRRGKNILQDESCL